jgi:hypothetical protein
MMLIEAVAQDRPRKVTTKYGERTVIDAVRRDNGEKVSLWRPANDPYSERFVTRNSPLTIAQDSKGKFALIENKADIPLSNPSLQSKPEAQPSKSSKDGEIHSYVV